MPPVLTTAATIRCIHGAPLVVTPSQSALTVAGQPVLLVSDLLTAAIPTCPNTNAAAGQAPCGKVTTMTTGASGRLSVRGTPVALATARGLTQALPIVPVAWQVVSPGQTTLSSD